MRSTLSVIFASCCAPQKIHTRRIYVTNSHATTQLLLPAHSWHAPSSMRTAPSVLRLVSILLDLAQGALQFLLLGTRSNACGPQNSIQPFSAHCNIVAF